MTGEHGVIYTIVIVTVNGVKCRALLDTGSVAHFISEKLVNLLGKRPILKQSRRMDMTLSRKQENLNLQCRDSKPKRRFQT